MIQRQREDFLQNLKDFYIQNPNAKRQAIWIYWNLPEVFQRDGLADFAKRSICFDLVDFWGKQAVNSSLSYAQLELSTYDNRFDSRLPQVFRMRLETLVEHFHEYPLSYFDLKVGSFYEASWTSSDQKYLIYLLPNDQFDKLEGINIGGAMSTVRIVENNQSLPYPDTLIYRRYA